MITNRRAFLTAALGGSGAALLPAKTPRLIPGEPLALGAGLSAAPAPLAPVVVSESLAENILKTVASELHRNLLDALVLGKDVQRNFAPIVARYGDTVTVPVPRRGPFQWVNVTHFENFYVVLDKHFGATAYIPDVQGILNMPMLSLYTRPMAVAIAEKVDESLAALRASSHRSLLVTRRIPAVLGGFGAMSRYVEHDCIGCRVTMSYDPCSLSQVFGMDVLAGCLKV